MAQNMQLSDESAIAASIVSFLKTTISSPQSNFSSEQEELLKVAVENIEKSFNVKDEQSKISLLKLYGIFKKTTADVAASRKPDISAAAAAAAAAAADNETSVVDEAAGERFKGEGNKLLASKEFGKAIEKYTAAIAANPNNAVYYGNRAAAYSQLGQHDSAVQDAKKAIQVNPDYSKAYSRLGHAEFCLQRYGNAVEAYTIGLEKEPENASIKQSLSVAKQKMTEMESLEKSSGMGAGGMPGMGGPGGLDFASMMKDPNIMKMAADMMKNPAMADMMKNPALQSMLGGAGGGGGMPDISALMNNPGIAAMAENMMKNPSAMQEMMKNPEVAKMAKELGEKKQ